MEKIYSYDFTGDADEKFRLDLTMDDYKAISEKSGYYIGIGIYKNMGFAYRFKDHLKEFAVRNGGIMSTVYAKNVTDIKRLIKAHYGSIYKDFKVYGELVTRPKMQK